MNEGQTKDETVGRGPNSMGPDAMRPGIGGYKRRNLKGRLLLIIAFGILGIILLFLFSLTLGVYPISFSDAVHSIWNIIVHLGPSDNIMDEKVIFHLRMSRSVAVLCVGAGLAAAGAAMQALIRNPLVDPYITGVSSGASFMVVLTIMTGFTIGATTLSIPLAAIIGAIIAFSVTMLVAEAAGGRAMSYVLSGVIISTGLSAAITLLIYFNVRDYPMIMKWMFGSFADMPWESTLMIMAGTTIPIIITMLYAKKLNIMLLGEEQAKYLGVDVSALKRGMLVLVAVLAAFCVAFCGVIGFIGLIIPHVCRMIIGGDHRLLIPSSAIVGALVLLMADVFCRVAAAPSELPIGAIVAVVGVPFFLFLMLKEGKRYAM